MKEKIDHPSFSAFLFEERIVCVDLKGGKELSRDDVQQMYEAYLKLGNGKKVRVMAISKKYAPLSTEAMKFAKASSGKYVSAAAMVISNNVNRIGIKFFMNFYKPEYPFNLFSGTKEAAKWLRDQNEH